MDLSKELEKDCDSRCQKFLNRYYRLIMKLAQRRLGDNFSPTEILSEAAIAYYRWFFYHSRSKRTKMPLSYSWFFNKRLDAYARNGGCSVRDDREWNSIRYYESDNRDNFFPGDFEDTLSEKIGYDVLLAGDNDLALEGEESLFHSALDNGAEDFTLSGEAKVSYDLSGDEDEVIHDEPYGAKYLVCIESFEKVPLLSSDLQRIFRHLSHDKQEANDIEYKKLTENRSIRRAAKEVRTKLQEQVSGTPYKLYVGICLNGARRHLLVLAQTEDEAREFLKPYGTVLELWA
jgi:hypothetical protein